MATSSDLEETPASPQCSCLGGGAPLLAVQAARGSAASNKTWKLRSTEYGVPNCTPHSVHQIKIVDLRGAPDWPAPMPPGSYFLLPSGCARKEGSKPYQKFRRIRETFKISTLAQHDQTHSSDRDINRYVDSPPSTPGQSGHLPRPPDLPLLAIPPQRTSLLTRLQQSWVKESPAVSTPRASCATTDESSAGPIWHTRSVRSAPRSSPRHSVARHTPRASSSRKSASRPSSQTRPFGSASGCS